MTRIMPRRLPTVTLSTRLSTAPAPERRALLAGIREVVRTLTSTEPPEDRATLLDRFETLLEPADPSAVWLALSVLQGELATTADVRRTVRAIRLDGVPAAFGSDTSGMASTWLTARRGRPDVRVLTGAVLVDVDHTARTGLATGIQRVARETVRRWSRDHDVALVSWENDHRSLTLLNADEQHKALTGVGKPSTDVVAATVVVPWESTYLLPELAPEQRRNERIAAIARFARGRTGVIGFDCVPVSTAETTAMGVSEAFVMNLSAVRHMDRLSAISQAAAGEYTGWRTMLRSIGEAGPGIAVDLLPAQAPGTSPEQLEATRAQVCIPGLPLVLCVGSHEPRKNHLALLHASELLWREGLHFNLVLVGGRGWNDERFQNAVAAARTRNRPVETVTTLSDEGLWAAYRLARCMVFPSLNEGFGLPVAEALACGTPVITSAYGSMAEIAAGGGALLVDPRDDRSIAAAMRQMLTDDDLHGRLAAEARARLPRTWDDYAADVWRSLTG